MTGPGRMVGHFRLHEAIGAGSFATVYRAYDERLHSEVVMKVLAENHSLNPEIRERFIAEGRCLRKVDSPHVVQLLDVGESDTQQPYLVLALADRGTLKDRVAMLRATGWRATRADVLAAARALAAALEAVHAAELVHRDLSPGNVLLTSTPSTSPDGGSALIAGDERVLVADLGLCKDLAVSSGLTVAGGTSGFRPPEASAGPALVDERSDLWSLSTLMLWLCEDASLPADLFHALERSLADDPEDRHRDVRDWLADVEESLAEPTAAEPAPSAGVGPRRHWWVLAIVVALLGGVALGGGVALWRTAPDDAVRSAQVAIDGPTEYAVGTPAIFTARTAGVESWTWTLPSGRYVVDEPTITLTASAPGSSRLVLRGIAADGTEVETTVRMTVTE